MTFYDAIGLVLRSIANVVGTVGDRQFTEPYQARQVVTSLQRLAALWPYLFACLAEENIILKDGRDNAINILESSADVPLDLIGSIEETDPARNYGRLISSIEGLMLFAHRHLPKPWAVAARQELRRALWAAALVQGRIVDAAFEAGSLA